MTDLHDQLTEQLTDLFDFTATDAEIPPLPLQDILTRGDDLQRVRRRRAAIWTATAAAAAVVAVSVPLAVATQHGHTSDRPAPAHQTSTSSPHPVGTPTASTAASVIANGAPTEFASRNGASAFVWSDCGAHRCRGAWQVVEKGASYDGVLPYPASDTTLTAGTDGFVVSDDTGDGFVIADDGSTKPLRVTPSGPQEPGVSLVPHADGMRLVDTKLGTWSTLTDDTGATFRTGDTGSESAIAGERIAAGAVELSWRSSADQPWQHRTLLSGTGDMTPGSVVTDGTRIAAVSAKVADDFDSVVGLSVSTDAGAHWHDIPASSLPFYDASQLAETSDGTLFVGGGQGLFRSTDSTWTHFAKVPGVSTWVLQPLSDGRMGVLLAAAKPPYKVVAVDGTGNVTPDMTLGTPLAQITPQTTASGASTGLVDTGPVTIPFVDHGTLYVHDKAIASGFTGVVAAGATVLGYNDVHSPGGAQHETVSQIVGDQAVPVPDLTSTGTDNHDTASPPVLSADGRLAVAMSWDTHGALIHGAPILHVTEVSLVDRRVLGTMSLSEGMIAPIEIEGINASGTVYYLDPQQAQNRPFTWTPGHTPTAVTGPLATEMRKEELLVQAHGTKSVPTRQAGTADGTKALTYDTKNNTAYVTDTATGTHVALHLTQPEYGPVGFESDRYVLIEVGSKEYGPLERCDTATGACTQILDSTRHMTFAPAGELLW